MSSSADDNQLFLQIESLRIEALDLRLRSHIQTQHSYSLCAKSRAQMQRGYNLCSSSQAQIRRSQKLRAKSHAQVQRGQDLCAKSRAQVQRSKFTLQQVKSQSWYKPQMEERHQRTLLAMRLTLGKAKALCSTIQNDADLLADNSAPNLQQIRLYREEINDCLREIRLIIKRYKFLTRRNEFVLANEHRAEEIITTLEHALIELEETGQWLLNMLEEHDHEYQIEKRIREIISMISRSI